jgi:predicted DNA-binding transcriptional regulator YafY
MRVFPIEKRKASGDRTLAGGRYSQISRLFYVMSLLDECPQGLTVNEIYLRVKDRFQVDKRSIYRDLEALDAAGFPVFEESDSTDNRVIRWKVNRTLKVAKSLVLSPRELVGLYLAKNALTPLKDTPFYQDLEGAFQKIESVLGAKCLEYLREVSTGIHFEPGPRWGLGIDSEVIDTVRACCEEGQLLSVEYSSQNSQSKRRRTLGPHFLYFAKGSVYLVAEDMEVNQTKVFSVPRMKLPKMLDEKYLGNPVDPNQFFEFSFSVFQGVAPEIVKLAFTPLVAQYIRERKWHSSQQLVPTETGGVIVTMHLGLSNELLNWILGFGCEVKVIEPASLQKRIVANAEGILRLYEKKQGAA